VTVSIQPGFKRDRIVAHSKSPGSLTSLSNDPSLLPAEHVRFRDLPELTETEAPVGQMQTFLTNECRSNKH